jgi:hypothetical protein
MATWGRLTSSGYPTRRLGAVVCSAGDGLCASRAESLGNFALRDASLKSTNSRKKLLDESFTARAAFGGISAVDSVDEFDDTDSRNSGLLVAGRIDDTGPTAR